MEGQFADGRRGENLAGDTLGGDSLAGDRLVQVGGSPPEAQRPCCVRALEAMHALALPSGLLISPEGMALEALPWLGAMLLGALAVTRLRLALVWLLLTAICIGFIIFVPIGVASQFYRMVDNPGSWMRVAYVLIVAGFSLFLLWRRDTMVWMREGGGKLSRAVF